MTGTLYYAQVLDGIGGSAAATFDATTVAVTGTATPTTSTQGGDVWTINGSSWNWVAPTLTVGPRQVANSALLVQGLAAQVGNLVEWRSSASAVYGTISENGYFTTRKTAAPADAELVAGEAAFWFDSTNGAAKLMVKGKSADGTVVTGSLALS
jgi:hypothetical protein